MSSNRSVMRLTWMMGAMMVAILAGSWPASSLYAAPVNDPRRDQVAAATSQALTELRRAIGAESIGDGYTVRDLIERTGTRKRFNDLVSRAQQIGGPRWLGSGETCEVKLEIAGGRVARSLVEIATLARLESPVPPEVLAGRLQGWNNRTFSATGASLGAGAVVGTTPRGKGVCDARDRAVQQTIAAISPIPLADGKTVGDAMRQPALGEEVERWLTARPITQIEFPQGADEARVALAVSPEQFFEAFRVAAGAAAVKQEPVPLPEDENGWARVRAEFASRITPSVTRGVAKSAPPQDAAAVKHAAINIPGAPAPAWVELQIEAEGEGAANSQLKAARAAEADAGQKLRAQLEPLPLADGLTIAQAVARDKRLEEALTRALTRARTTQVDYRGRDSATVKVQLDLRDVWRELESSR